jgi:hypothetical protein
VSLISGVGVQELRSQESQSLRKVMLNSVGFILGFSIVFIALGAISPEVGQLLAQYNGAFTHARQSVVAGTAAGIKHLLIDPLSIVPHPQMELPRLIANSYLDSPRSCVLERVPQRLGRNPVDVVAHNRRQFPGSPSTVTTHSGLSPLECVAFSCAPNAPIAWASSLVTTVEERSPCTASLPSLIARRASSTRHSSFCWASERSASMTDSA